MIRGNRSRLYRVCRINLQNKRTTEMGQRKVSVLSEKARVGFSQDVYLNRPVSDPVSNGECKVGARFPSSSEHASLSFLLTPSFSRSGTRETNRVIDISI